MCVCAAVIRTRKCIQMRAHSLLSRKQFFFTYVDRVRRVYLQLSSGFDCTMSPKKNYLLKLCVRLGSGCIIGVGIYRVPYTLFGSVAVCPSNMFCCRSVTLIVKLFSHIH